MNRGGEFIFLDDGSGSSLSIIAGASWRAALLSARVRPREETRAANFFDP
jgi:hypothetical protein